MFISPAFASGVETAKTSPSIFMSMMPLLIILFIFYLFLFRPQQKRMQEYQKLVNSLRRGDRIVTTGGIIGTISKVEEGNPDVQVEIAEGVKIRLQRNAIAEILAKTPVTDAESASK